MIDLYNNLIIIILVIIISILFTKLIYSNNYLSIENFQDGFNYRYYYGKLGQGDNKFNVEGGVIDRLSKDPDVLKAIRSNFKNDYYTNIIPKINQNKDAFTESENIRDNVQMVPTKFANIIDKYQDLNNEYNLKKKQIEASLIKDLKKQDTLTQFNVKNLKLKKKLKKLTDSVVDSRNQERYTNFILLKNQGSNTEITITKNNNLEQMNKYRSGTSFTYNDDVEYYFVDVNNKCLSCEGKNDFTLKICNSQLKEQLFILHEIKNNELYNKFIKLSGNYKSEDIIDVLDTSITYPFYLLSPFMIPGYCLYVFGDQLSIKSIRNDPYQRFDEIFFSTFCDVTNLNNRNV